MKLHGGLNPATHPERVGPESQAGTLKLTFVNMIFSFKTQIRCSPSTDDMFGVTLVPMLDPYLKSDGKKRDMTQQHNRSDWSQGLDCNKN